MMWNGSSSYGATVGNGVGDVAGVWVPWWKFGVCPIQDRD